MAGIYIHVPFCKQACHYCDFHFSTNLSSRNALVDCILKELTLRQGYLRGSQINTIYFGGGTPSILELRQLESILQQIYNQFRIAGDAEITLEANPDDLDLNKLSGLNDVGINRLSIGIQSFDDNILKFFNRPHDSGQSVKCIENARKAGFKNLSIDLIYAVQGQSSQAWLDNVKKAIELCPEHISAYSLTIEPRTAFGNWLKKGELQQVSDDDAAADLTLLVNELSKSGYEQYEISNFSKPGFQSRHNSNYWKQEPYLGIGPSAHSYNGASRQFNIANNTAYIRSLEKEIVPFELEMLTNEDMANEYLLTTLRTSWGADLTLLMKRFDYDINSIHRRYLDNLIGEGYATTEQGILKLTAKGKLVADKISSDLFMERRS